MTLKLFYAAGPGDIIAAHRHWQSGGDDPTQMSLTYSGQFADTCQELGATAYLVSSNDRQGFLQDGNFTLEHRPKRLLGRGALYHMSEILYGLGLLRSALRFNADIAVISSGTTHYAVLSLFSFFRIKVITVLHNTLWPKGHPPTRLSQRAILGLDTLFFRYLSDAVIGVSPECIRQVNMLTHGTARSLYVMYPQFRRENFEGIPPPNREGYPFRIVFAGRIERNKGVFDILEIARQVEELQPGLVRWDICGDGSELTQLIQKHGAMDLGSVVTIHGWTDPVRLRVLQGQSHLSIVPTRGDFAEGMAKTALEAILAGRPVIASSVTPALEILGAAATTVESENIPEYVEKISTIAKDRERYGALVSACKDIQELLYDKGNSFVSTLKRIIINDLRR